LRRKFVQPVFVLAAHAGDIADREDGCAGRQDPGSRGGSSPSTAYHGLSGAAGDVSCQTVPQPPLHGPLPPAAVAPKITPCRPATSAPLAVVEAMKMENVLRAERDGRIACIRAKPCDSLAVDAVILEFE
jgi:hypothetical protein